jgi:hypothetical protein
MSTTKEPNWKDTSSYAQGERGKIEPSAWELKLPNIRITVHRLYRIPDCWFMSCHLVGIEGQNLNCGDLEAAKVKALAIVKAKLSTALEEMGVWGRNDS